MRATKSSGKGLCSSIVHAGLSREALWLQPGVNAHEEQVFVTSFRISKEHYQVKMASTEEAYLRTKKTFYGIKHMK